MVIEIGYWIIPLVLSVGGLLFLPRQEKRSGGYGPDLTPLFGYTIWLIFSLVVWLIWALFN